MVLEKNEIKLNKWSSYFKCRTSQIFLYGLYFWCVVSTVFPTPNSWLYSSNLQFIWNQLEILLLFYNTTSITHQVSRSVTLSCLLCSIDWFFYCSSIFYWIQFRDRAEYLVREKTTFYYSLWMVLQILLDMYKVTVLEMHAKVTK